MTEHLHQLSEIEHPILAWILFAPLLGSLFVFLRPNRGEMTQKLSGWLATPVAFVAFLGAAFAFTLLGDSGANSIAFHGGSWFSVGDLHVDFTLRLDHLSAVMCLIITGVGSLIHLYAIGYMSHDEHQKRFFSYLNLFLFAMLTLVLGDNLLLMFVGWEGVGLCSYLLIGFWYREMPNAIAGQKAFVVNRIGDAGFLIGIFTLFIATKTITFGGLGVAVPGLAPSLIEFAAFALFIGAVGKSAQIPLYVWLPDAMAGPTPVSALIHAATMVTAGVYMIARMSFLYALAPHTSVVILVVGCFTALLAATIALVQTDIKRVLAYSTVSQLGFMFMAMGAGAYSNGIYHVVTHAFFKACLFMAAGSVIIGCHHEQDMREFGGLRKTMPLTFITYFIATLAIAGFPFLSGFYSKDAILWTVFSTTGLASQIHVGPYPLSHVIWGLGAFTALLTAFYMTRSLVLTFFGEYRGHAHPHESPAVVTIPLIVLAFLSAVFGYFKGEHFLEYLEYWTRADLQGGHEALEHNHMYHVLEQTSIGIALLGIAAAAFIYGLRPSIARNLASTFPWFFRALSNKWWVDELYAAIIVRPLGLLSDLLFALVDRSVIDASVNGAGNVVEATGEAASRAHSGLMSSYILWMFSGTIVILLFWFLL